MKLRILAALALCIFLTAGAAQATTTATRMLQPYLHHDGVRALPSKDPAPIVGDTRVFWAWDLTQMPPDDKQISATCRGVSGNGYVFVEDAQWNVEMDQADVDAILNAWDVETPVGSVDPGKGIFDIETSLFGDPPDVDGWPGIVLLYYELGCFMGTCFDGFFRDIDEGSESNSNMMEMLHLEATQSDPGDEYMLGVTAHEFNHMLQWNTDPSENMWLSESLAEAAMIVTGYDTDLAWLDDFVQNPSTTFWDDQQSVHYGAALLMGTYFYEFGGAELLQALVADDANGVGSVENQLIDLELAESFGWFFGELATAIAADFFVDGGAADADGQYHYEYLSVGELSWDETLDSTEDANWVKNLAAGSLAALRANVTGVSELDLSLSGDSADELQAAVVAVTPDGLIVSRFDKDDAEWPNPKADTTGADTVLVVLANPELFSVSVSVDLSFVQGSDDDAGDDDSGDDTGDDDDDADDAAGDDDDDGGGGCCG